MGDINFRAITWHGLLWQQKGNYIRSKTDQNSSIWNIFSYNYPKYEMTFLGYFKSTNSSYITKRNNAMMSKPKTCWVKKLVSKKEKGKLSSSKFFVPQVIFSLHLASLLSTHMCPFCGVNIILLRRKKDLLKLDIIIQESNMVTSFSKTNENYCTL